MSVHRRNHPRHENVDLLQIFQGVSASPADEERARLAHLNGAKELDFVEPDTAR